MKGTAVPYFIAKNLISKEKIEQLAKEHLQNSSVYLTGVKIMTGNSILVFIDGDEGVKIADCVALSRYIEGNLDRNKEDYSLDVSSHGAATPLVMPRQYKKHLGREFDLVLTDGTKESGEMIACDENGLTLKYSVRENKPIGKGKITVEKQTNIKFEQIRESKIKLKF